MVKGFNYYVWPSFLRPLFYWAIHLSYIWMFLMHYDEKVSRVIHGYYLVVVWNERTRKIEDKKGDCQLFLGLISVIVTI